MRSCLGIVLLLPLACGGSGSSYEPADPSDIDAPSSALVAEDATETTPEPKAAPAPAQGVDRPELDAILDAGPGAFLGRFEVRPFFNGKKFSGWELVGFTDPSSSLASAGLEPGDVVRRVNGHRIERPKHLEKLWTELRTASAIVVKGTRGGEPFELRFSVGAGTVKSASKGS